MRDIAEAARSGREQLLQTHMNLADAGLDGVLRERFDKWEKETERELENIFPLRDRKRHV